MAEPPSEPSQVVIVGGGPTGLLLALLLARRQVPVRVIERRPGFDQPFRGEVLNPPVAQMLDDLGVLPELVAEGAARPLVAPRFWVLGRAVRTPRTEGAGSFAVSPGALLWLLHAHASREATYQLELGTAALRPMWHGERIGGVEVRRADGTREELHAALVVLAVGADNPLVGKFGFASEVREGRFQVVRVHLPTADPALIPPGVEVHVGLDTVTHVHPGLDHRLLLAWHVPDDGSDRDFETLRERLLAAIPARYGPLVAERFVRQADRETQAVVCRRLARWAGPGALVLGDAAHTMTPVAQQSLNLALRDAVVAGNHLAAVHAQGRLGDPGVLSAIEAERRPEVDAIHGLQLDVAERMFGTPTWRRHLALAALPFLPLRDPFHVRVFEQGTTRVEVAPEGGPVAMRGAGQGTTVRRIMRDVGRVASVVATVMAAVGLVGFLWIDGAWTARQALLAVAALMVTELPIRLAIEGFFRPGMTRVARVLDALREGRSVDPPGVAQARETLGRVPWLAAGTTLAIWGLLRPALVQAVVATQGAAAAWGEALVAGALLAPLVVCAMLFGVDLALRPWVAQLPAEGLSGPARWNLSLGRRLALTLAFVGPYPLVLLSLLTWRWSGGGAGAWRMAMGQAYFLGTSLSLLGLFAYYVRQTVEQPVSMLAAAMAGLREGRGVQLPVASDDAIGVLASGFNAMATAVAARQRLDQENARLLRLASTDPLTGLYNRRAFEVHVGHSMAEAHRYRRPLALLLLDLDHFKRINDTYGHPVGDQAILRVARVLEGMLRSSDVAGRWGGEEFVLALPSTPLEGAVILAERLRQAVRDQHLYDQAGNRLPVTMTVSIGVSVLGADPGLTDVVSRADEAVYRAKAEGRDRVVVWSEQEGVPVD